METIKQEASMKQQISNFIEKQIPADAIEICAFEKPFDWENSVDVFTKIEEELNKLKIVTKIKTRIIHVVIECVDNIRKHSYNFKQDTLSNFVCLYHNSKLFIITANLIPKEEVTPLPAMIDSINMLDKTGVSEMYKYQLKHGTLSNSGNAGLGLLGIARKSVEELKYTIEEVNMDYSLFIFLATLDIEL